PSPCREGISPGPGAGQLCLRAAFAKMSPQAMSSVSNSAPQAPGAAGGVTPTPGEAAASMRVHLLALLGYLALALLVTYPAIAQFGINVPGDLLADRDQNLWNLWWVREAIAHATNPYHTGMLYYPYGVDLYYHTLGLPLGLIGLLPQLLFGLPAAYNTVLIAAFTLSGYGAFRLALRFISPDDGRALPSWAVAFVAFVGGVVFAFTPYTLDALKGQLEVLSLQWMPFYAEAWVMAWRAGRLRYGVLAGVFFALAALSSLYYAVYLAIFSLAYVVYQLWARRGVRAKEEGRGWGGLLPPLVVAPIVALVLTLPLLVGLVRDRDNPRLAVEAGVEHKLAHSADLLSFVAPPHDHPLLGWDPADRPGVNEPAIHDYLSLGYVALARSVVGGVVGWRTSRGRFWVGLALLALVLSMGPQLQVGRALTGVPLPFRLLEWLPGAEAIAKPERLVVLVRLCMGVLAAWGGGWLLSRLVSARVEARGRTVAICAAVLALLLVELPIHPRYVQRLDVPGGFRAIAGQEGGALMELPFATQQIEVGGERMRYQTAHGHPIMGGYLARTYNSPSTDSCGPFWSFISARYLPIEGRDIVSPTMTSRPLDILSYYNIGYVALYNNYHGPGTTPLDPQERGAFEDILSRVSHAPLYTDDYVSLHKVDPQPREDIQPALMVSDGWYEAEDSGGEPFRWVQGQQGRLCVFAPRATTASLALDATAFAKDQKVSIVGRFNFVTEEKSPPTANRILLTTPTTYGRSQPLYDGLVSTTGTPVRTDAVEFPAGMTEVRIVPQTEGVTPQSLDPSVKDDRALTVGFKRVRLERVAPK
ncbi:MAG TPA: hypothetical protein VND68_14985, partial [Chloroflexia bacterium]|nr:hypothetical protein [Chloroflexia bacterium]